MSVVHNAHKNIDELQRFRVQTPVEILLFITTSININIPEIFIIHFD